MTYAIFLILFLCAGAFSAGPAGLNAAVKPHACGFFTYISAEKLLSGKVTGVDSEESTADGGRQWRCTFTSGSGNGKIHFGLFTDPTEEAAKAEFQKVRLSNEKHEGFEDWPGIGDEALAHTDGRTFQFVMVRKGNQTIRIKLNPIDGSTLNDVKTVATLLVKKLK